MRSTCIPSSSPDWLVRASSSLFECGEAWLLPTAYGRPPLALLPRRWVPGSADGATHAHTRRQRREQRRKAALAPTQAVSPAQTPPPRQHRHPLQLLVLFLQLGLHLAQPILDAAVSLSPIGQEQRQLHSQQPCPDSMRAVIAGAASGPCSVRTTGPGFAGGTPACLLTQPVQFCV